MARGGARRGAGRKPIPGKKRVMTSFSDEQLALLDLVRPARCKDARLVRELAMQRAFQILMEKDEEQALSVAEQVLSRSIDQSQLMKELERSALALSKVPFQISFTVKAES